jgi:hypothetical protein
MKNALRFPPCRLGAMTAALAVLTGACIPVPPPAGTVDPQGRPITTADIRLEMHDGHQTLDAILLGLAGGAVGMVVGGKIGYDIGYAHDIRQGCEDCGLGGLLGGVTLGFIAGTIAGGNVGMHLGAGADRNAAIARIIRRRAQEQQPSRRASRGGLGPAYPFFISALPPSLAPLR